MRPELKFKIIPPSVTYYLKFDPTTGNIIGCSVEKKGNCLKIDEELGRQIKSGQKSFTNYKAVLIGNEYVVQPKNFVTSKPQTDIKIDEIENKNLYRIKVNTKDSCVRFLLNLSKKTWTITIDDQLRKTLQNSLNLIEDNLHNFYAVDTDNPNLLECVLTLNINMLIKDGIIQQAHALDTVPALYCRKVYNYSLEVVL